MFHYWWRESIDELIYFYHERFYIILMNRFFLREDLRSVAHNLHLRIINKTATHFTGLIHCYGHCEYNLETLNWKRVQRLYIQNGGYKVINGHTFDHQNPIHNVTWIHPVSKQGSLIHYVIVSKRSI